MFSYGEVAIKAAKTKIRTPGQVAQQRKEKEIRIAKEQAAAKPTSTPVQGGPASAAVPEVTEAVEAAASEGASFFQRAKSFVGKNKGAIGLGLGAAAVAGAAGAGIAAMSRKSASLDPMDVIAAARSM